MSSRRFVRKTAAAKRDEDLIADILASVLLEKPLARSKEILDSLYNRRHETAQKIKIRLEREKLSFLKEKITSVFSHIDSAITKDSSEPKALRKQIMGKGTTASSIKTPFYSVFMAFYDLMVKESMIPSESGGKILQALGDLNKKLEIQTHHATSDQRTKNINAVKGLIQDCFVKKEPSELLHGPGLVLDFENSLRRSKIETPRYEMKQGLLSLDESRTFNKDLIKRLAQTACAIANIGPESKGFIHIGVTDQKEDVERIQKTDSIKAAAINSCWAVGVDREAEQTGKTLEQYVHKFVSEFKKTPISENLKADIVHHIDIINYKGFSVIRLTVGPQDKISYYDKECFIREGDCTKKADGPAMEALVRRFPDRRRDGGGF